MRLLYLDTCAAIKLFKQEVESEALEQWLLRQAPARQVTSHLTRTELRRGLHAVAATSEAHGRADHWLQRCAVLAYPAQLFDAAGAMTPDTRLRSLDALHVAAALSLGPALAHFVTYDKRLAEVASSQGLPVVAPS